MECDVAFEVCRQKVRSCWIIVKRVQNKHIYIKIFAESHSAAYWKKQKKKIANVAIV